LHRAFCNGLAQEHAATRLKPIPDKRPAHLARVQPRTVAVENTLQLCSDQPDHSLHKNLAQEHAAARFQPVGRKARMKVRANQIKVAQAGGAQQQHVGQTAGVKPEVLRQIAGLKGQAPRFRPFRPVALDMRAAHPHPGFGNGAVCDLPEDQRAQECGADHPVGRGRVRRQARADDHHLRPAHLRRQPLLSRSWVPVGQGLAGGHGGSGFMGAVAGSWHGAVRAGKRRLPVAPQSGPDNVCTTYARDTYVKHT
jgi:hypothetical protein